MLAIIYETEFPLKFTTEYRNNLSKDEPIEKLYEGASEKIKRINDKEIF